MLRLLILLACLVVPTTGAAGDEFWIPGADFGTLDLREGVWCRYVVVDEALGQTDSTDVYIGVPERTVTDRGPAFWIELSTGLRDGWAADRNVMRMLVLEGIQGFSMGDLLGQYVLELYIRDGDGPVRQEDPLEYEAFTRVIPTTDSSWVTTGPVPVTTPGGTFSCTLKTRAVEETQEIPTGNVKLIKRARDDVSTWFADDIPLFRLARCVIDRTRETETIPRISGVPVAGARRSTTTAELLSFGFDASPILPSVPERTGQRRAP